MTDSVQPCPCGGLEHPTLPANPPGLARVAYRAGDFLSFRRALLQSLPKEQALTAWRPSSQGDLILQALEWWAYIADVLTFYTERSLNENLLGTAELDESVRRIVRLLGYRPRPGIAANADLAALLLADRAELPAGFAVTSKPAPGKAPQDFETDAPLVLARPDAVTAVPPGRLADASGRIYLQGSVTDLRVGEMLILHLAGASATAAILLRVAAVTTGKDPAGQSYTAITPDGAPTLPAASARAYRLLRSRRSLGLWRYSTPVNLVDSPMDADGLERATQPGDFIVLEAPDNAGLTPRLLRVTGSTEQVWYANGTDASPPAPPAIPVPIPHSRLYYSPSVSNSSAWDAIRAQVKALVDWQPAGALRDVPLATYDGSSKVLVAAEGQRFRIGDAQTLLIEDAAGQGIKATANVSAETPERLEIISFATPPPPLALPLRVLHNVFTLTRGRSVAGEILGSGNALALFQEFVLAKSPLTYLPAGDGYQSTLKIYVNGVRWTEVANFLDQPPDARVFATREDEENRTHVLFGDGVNGARLPTGRDNLVAFYRYGSGADAPAADGLTLVAKPVPGLGRLRQPVAAGGGADPDSPSRIRRYAPSSVLTFGRAVSADDYEAIAVQAAGVARVKAAYAWSAAEQRATVSLYVGDTPAAVESARKVLAVAADPNRPVSVVAASPVGIKLSLTLEAEADRLPEQVAARVLEVLGDPDRGLLGERRVAIGEGLYFSRISAACTGVAGVLAVTAVKAELDRPDPATGLSSLVPEVAPRISVGAGEFLRVPEGGIAIAVEVQNRA